VTSLDADFDIGNAAENPALLAAANALTNEEQPPALQDPLDGPVTLPVGFRRVKAGDGFGFEEVRKAWVRELNGEDEERIAKAKMRDDASAFVTAVLEAGVEKLGESRPTKDDLNLLVLGDRDFLLMEIARVTYGDEIEYANFGCPGCGEEFDVSLSLSEDVPVKRLEKVTDSYFEVPLKKDRIASVNLPTQEISLELAKAQTPAEANTILIMHSVEEIRGPGGNVRISGDKDAARKLGITDRQTLVQEMSERMPGPQYNEVRFKHEPGCGTEVRLEVTLADLFRGM
jgi:hypothetical protein